MALLFGYSEIQEYFKNSDISVISKAKLSMNRFFFFLEDLLQIYFCLYVSLMTGQTYTFIQLASPAVSIIMMLIFRTDGFTKIRNLRRETSIRMYVMFHGIFLIPVIIMLYDAT